MTYTTFNKIINNATTHLFNIFTLARFTYTRIGNAHRWINAKIYTHTNTPVTLNVVPFCSLINSPCVDSMCTLKKVYVMWGVKAQSVDRKKSVRFLYVFDLEPIFFNDLKSNNWVKTTAYYRRCVYKRSFYFLFFL